MFDSLFKPKFYTKCKSSLKLIKRRLELIRKKRYAVQKFLKKDIADLLRSDLDYNAYGRAEGLLIEQNMSSCYELVAKFAGCVSGHVRDLCKQRDFADEGKVAVQSLIYAAAKFSDLPELRKLRTLFTEKFGNSLESYTSKEFVEKLRQDPPSKEMKIQLLHDLAQKFSIKWDSTTLERRLSSLPQLPQGKAKHDPLNDHDVKWHKNNNDQPPDDNSQKAKQHQQTKLVGKGDSWEDDYEERILDELLMHYSKKQSPHESGIGTHPEAYNLQRQEHDNGHSKSNSMETIKLHGRATPLVLEMSRTARHVHPCLPDYDDLPARIAALRKTIQQV